MGATWVIIDKSQVVSKVPCRLLQVVITSKNTTNYANFTLYNGESATDPFLCLLRCERAWTQSVIFQNPIYCNRGLYVVIDLAGTTGLICYEPLTN